MLFHSNAVNRRRRRRRRRRVGSPPWASRSRWPHLGKGGVEKKKESRRIKKVSKNDCQQVKIATAV